MEELKRLKEKYNAWLVVEYKSNQDNTERTATIDYIVFADKNYFINGGREESLDISMFKNYLGRVVEKLNGDKKERLFNIIKDVKQFYK